MSKSLGNIITPKEVLDEFGIDTFRLYAIGATNSGLDLNYNKDDVKTRFRSLGVLWNTQNYLLEYAKGLKLKPNTAPKGKEERYILSKLNSAIAETSQLFETMKLDKVPREVEELLLELSRSYIQFTREKMLDQHSKQEVVSTIYTVLLGTIKLLAPIAPFIAEDIFQNLKAAFGIREESVHLCPWPKSNPKLIDRKLEAEVELANSFIQGLLNCREKAKLGIRWPIGEAVIELDKGLKHIAPLIQKQTNIKSLKNKLPFSKKYTIKPNFKTLGATFGKQLPKVVELIAKTNPDNLARSLKQGEVKLAGHKLQSEHVILEEVLPEGWVGAETKAGSVYVCTKLSQELEQEGYAREIMRRIQTLRKAAGLVKENAITLAVSGPIELERFSKEIKEKCGVSVLHFSEKQFEHTEEHTINGKNFRLSLSKI
jgi:isoleucyl-tRNA synthetase